ncbi:MAG: aminotransferase class IV [Anaerolineaceae bacterium]|nr:aminotransferase class IV [Anaerolineaceae bacterium]
MSPVLRKRLTPGGLQDVACEAESLQQAADSEPGGVYTVSNTQRGRRVLHLDAHLDRLEDSARREGFPLKLERARLRMALRSMLDEADYPEMRFRLNVPRFAPDEMLITIEPWRALPSSLYREGVCCVTVAGLTRQNPRAKDSAWLQQRGHFRLPPDCYEALLLAADGTLLEGLGSNFHAVLAGELRTAGSGVLAGITRNIVLQIAPDILPVRLTGVHLEDLPSLQEAFLSSSSRGLMPVVRIDTQFIGSGKPGPVTLALGEAFERYLVQHLEAL